MCCDVLLFVVRCVLLVARGLVFVVVCCCVSLWFAAGVVVVCVCCGLIVLGDVLLVGCVGCLC